MLGDERQFRCPSMLRSSATQFTEADCHGHGPLVTVLFLILLRGMTFASFEKHGSPLLFGLCALKHNLDPHVRRGSGCHYFTTYSMW